MLPLHTQYTLICQLSFIFFAHLLLICHLLGSLHPHLSVSAAWHGASSHLTCFSASEIMSSTVGVVLCGVLHTGSKLIWGLMPCRTAGMHL